MPKDRKALAGIKQTGDRRAKVPLELVIWLIKLWLYMIYRFFRYASCIMRILVISDLVFRGMYNHRNCMFSFLILYSYETENIL